MTAPVEDAVYRNAAGDEVRIDRVTAEWVYFVTWRAGEEVGEPKRMTPALFAEVMETHGMEAVHV